MLITGTERSNPYIVGRPIYEPNLFFGRRKLFKFIEDNLKQNVQVILLHGQRRIGKSSVLMQIPNFVGLDEFVFIYFDLHDKTRLPLDNILQSLAAAIVDKLNLPKPESFDLNYAKFFLDEFLPQVIDSLQEKNQKMVWLLDEFDVLNDQSSDSSIESFFPYLQTLISQYRNLFIISVVGRRIEDLTNFKSLFKQAPNQEIGLLEKSAAKELINKPAEKYLKYNLEAIDAILDLTSGHPYFTQVVCHALFLKAEEEDKLEISREDVNQVIDDAIEISEGGLSWFRDGLPISERVVFSAVAQAEKMVDKTINSAIENPLTLLREYGVMATEALSKAPENLVAWGFLDRVENGESRYQIKVKLVRYWLVKRYPLRQAIWELENADLDASQLFELVEEIHQHRDLSISTLYEPVLEINPNHFTVLFKLAEYYLDTKNFEKALKKYERANKIDSTRVNYEYSKLRNRAQRKIISSLIPVARAGMVIFIVIVSGIFLNMMQPTKTQLITERNSELLKVKYKQDKELVDLIKQAKEFYNKAQIDIIAGIKGQNAILTGAKNIRSGPSLEYRVVGKVHTNDRVQILSISFDQNGYQWYEIYDPKSGTKGWIDAKLLTATNPPLNEPRQDIFLLPRDSQTSR